MDMTTANPKKIQTESQISTLPSEDIRQIMWRYADRYDLQMAVQATKSVARGPVARLVANGGRNSHEWTKEKAEALVKLLWWMTHEGQQFTKLLHYAPLPDKVVVKIEKVLKSITYNGHSII